MRFGLLLLLVMITGCADTPAPPSPDSSRQIIEDVNAGISFQLPPHWYETPSDSHRVFSGPQGTPEYFTTITLQTLSPRWDPTPDLALATLLKETRDIRPDVLAQIPLVLTTTTMTQPGLLYSLAFLHHREPFRRIGVLLPSEGRLLDINYTANTALFAQSLPVFQEVLNSLGVSP